MREVRQFAERINAPVAMTLLRLGAFPASHSLNIGMMGMHGKPGESRHPGNRPAARLGMRFDDRVTGNIKTTRSTRRRFTSTSIRRDRKNVIADGNCRRPSSGAKELLGRSRATLGG
jgi:thiamine pyrophosphate-dependent acetolactate synthase large subunit-like protein